MAASQNQIIEYVVLFKLNEENEANSRKISSMINGLNELINLNQVLYLSVAPIHRLKSTSVFTHVLHSRYKSKEDLNDYAINPDHVRIVKESAPIREDIVAVDYIADQVPEIRTPNPGSLAKITLLKLKDDLTDEVKSEIIQVIKMNFPGIDQITAGENFSPGRAKGFSIGSIAYFKDLGEMELVDAQKKLHEEKYRDYLDDTIVVEFVVPSSL